MHVIVGCQPKLDVGDLAESSSTTLGGSNGTTAGGDAGATSTSAGATAGASTGTGGQTGCAMTDDGSDTSPKLDLGPGSCSTPTDDDGASDDAPKFDLPGPDVPSVECNCAEGEICVQFWDGTCSFDAVQCEPNPDGCVPGRPSPCSPACEALCGDSACENAGPPCPDDLPGALHCYGS